LQPDIYWAGGLSETLKIAAMARAADLIVIPHGHSTPAGLHFTLAQSPILTPYQEYLVKWNAINQFFLAHRLEPANGVLTHPTQPGLGMDLEEARIEAKVELEA
jgi:L-alanine-DL-glutamate epimerase-like enolase superfamily enzyme